MAEARSGAAVDAMGRARACVGARLDDIGGAGVGRIERVLVDAVDGSPTWLVIRTRRFARRSCVPAGVVALAAGHAWAPYPRETIRASSEIDSAAGLVCADERELAAHFGMPERAGRLLAIAGREDADDGSIPV
jgi:hypothetical protein